MKSPVLLFAAAATALALGPAAHAAASCRLPGGHAFAADHIARLITLPTPDGEALYACIRRTGRKVPLDVAFTDARLAGRWVAWQRHVGGKWLLAVHDLRSGRERMVDGHAAEHSLFLTTTGTVVWAEQLAQDVGVFANDPKTDGHLLGRGAIDPSSLRVVDGHVSWRADGATYTAEVR